MATIKKAQGAQENELVLKINGNAYSLPCKVTTASKVKTAVKSIILYNGWDIKTAVITLPSGRKIHYKQLNNCREFCKLLFTGVYLIPAEEEEFDRLTEVMQLVTLTASKKKINWDNVGNNSIEYGAELFLDTLAELLNVEAITPEEYNYFENSINSTKQYYNAK
jgi:hypothetical protein